MRLTSLDQVPATFNRLAELCRVSFGEVSHAQIWIHPRALHDLRGARGANTVNVPQRVRGLFVVRDVYAYKSHVPLL